MKKVILIDAEERTITEIEAEDNICINKALQCDVATIIFLDEFDIYVDYEGHLKAPQHFFGVDEYAWPIPTRGVVVWHDESVTGSAEKISRSVNFLDEEEE